MSRGHARRPCRRRRPVPSTRSSTRRSRPPCSRSSSTSPAGAGTSRRASTRWCPPPSWSPRSPSLAHAMGLDESAAAGSLTPVEQEPLGGRRPRAVAGVDHLAAGREPAARPWSSGWCCHPTPRPTVLEDPAGARGVRARAPRPPGRPDRRGRDARRGDVLRAAAAGRRRRPVRADRRRPGARPACAVARHSGRPARRRAAMPRGRPRRRRRQ